MFLCDLAFSRGKQTPLVGVRVGSRTGLDAVVITSRVDFFGSETVLKLRLWLTTL